MKMHYTYNQILCNVWITWIISVNYTPGTHAQIGTYSVSLINKPTNQSSVYIEGEVIGSSDKAVDGNLNNDFHQSSCTHTNTDDEQPWWAVDMGDLVTVFSITITNRGDCCRERLDRFSVYGSTTAFNPYEDENRQLCYKFDGEFGAGVTRTFNCSEAVTARYLSITLPPGGFLVLCEVQIQAVCPDGTYGENCTGICSVYCKSPPCDKFTASGTCPVGPTGKCEAGYMGDNCTTPCAWGTYGDGCQSCSPYCRHECAPTSTIALCNDGCVAGYMGDTCGRECPSGTFGENCVVICYCKQGTCNPKTGLGCVECEDGYTGETCSVRVTTTTSTTTKTTTRLAHRTTSPTSTYLNTTPGGTIQEDETQKVTIGAQQTTGGPPCICTTGGVIIGLAILVTVLGVLCLVLIIVLIVLVMKQHKARQSDSLSPRSQETNQAAMYVNVAADSGKEENHKNLKSEVKYEDISLDIHNDRNEAGPYEKLDSLEVQRDLHQPYQELRK